MPAPRPRLCRRLGQAGSSIRPGECGVKHKDRAEEGEFERNAQLGSVVRRALREP